MQAIRTASLEEHLTEAFEALRGALDEAVRSVGLSPSQPQVMARKLAVSRNLTWKISKVVCHRDLYAALQHLPGDEGIQIFVASLLRAGAAPDCIDRINEACSRFGEFVERHAGDRQTLDLMLEGLTNAHDGDRLEQSRKMAFRGNSGIWGAQARVRLNTAILAPSNRNPDHIDAALIGGLIDFRVLRPGIRWPLSNPRFYTDDGTPLTKTTDEEALDPIFAASEGPPMLGSFCKPGLPKIHRAKTALGYVYELEADSIGNTGQQTCMFGSIQRRAFPRKRTARDEFGELLTHVSLPVEHLQFDVMAHKDLAFVIESRLHVRGSSDGSAAGPGSDQLRIPISERPAELTGRPVVVSSPLVASYDKLVGMAMDRCGWNLRDFRAIRLLVPYPPMHASFVLKFLLPT